MARTVGSHFGLQNTLEHIQGHSRCFGHRRKSVFRHLAAAGHPNLFAKEKHTALEMFRLSQDLVEQNTMLRWCNSDQQLSDGMAKVSAQDKITKFLQNGQRWNIAYDAKFTAAKKVKAAKTDPQVDEPTTVDPSWLDILNGTSGHVNDSTIKWPFSMIRHDMI